MSTYDLFDIAERLEAVAEELYLCLAKRCAPGQPGRPPLESLASEEHQHIQRVRMMRRRLLSDSDSLGDVRLDLTEAAALLQRTTRLLEDLEATSVVAPERAREITLATERDLALAHAHMLAPGCVPALREFLVALARQDREHIALLEKGRAG